MALGRLFVVAVVLGHAASGLRPFSPTGSTDRIQVQSTVGSHRKGMKRFRFLGMKTFVQDSWPKCLLMVCRQLA